MAGDASLGSDVSGTPMEPLSGESDPSDVGIGRGLGGLGPGGGMGEASGNPGPLTQLGEALAGGDDISGMDPGTSGPGRMAHMGDPMGNPAETGLSNDNDLQSATDNGMQTGFAQTTRREQTAGMGGIPERGTTAGMRTAASGTPGGTDQGLSGTQATAKRSTVPLSEQGTITGTEGES